MAQLRNKGKKIIESGSLNGGKKEEVKQGYYKCDHEHKPKKPKREHREEGDEKIGSMKKFGEETVKKFGNKRNELVMKSETIKEVKSDEESHDIDDIDQSISEHSISS